MWVYLSFFFEIVMDKSDCYPLWKELMVWDLTVGLAIFLSSGGRMTLVRRTGNLKILKSDLRVLSFIAK